MGTFFKVVVQAVLLFGLETSVMTPCMGRALRSFQHIVARRITERQPKKLVDEIWEYPPLETEREEAGFEEMGAYVLKRQNMVAQYIATRRFWTSVRRRCGCLGSGLLGDGGR